MDVIGMERKIKEFLPFEDKRLVISLSEYFWHKADEVMTTLIRQPGVLLFFLFI